MDTKAFSRVYRGQVWYINLPDDKNRDYYKSKYDQSIRVNGSVIGKSRPWLVISNNKNNMYSSTFNAVPITTKEEKDNYPMHVYFMRDNNNKYQCIECEQPRTFNLDDIDYDKSPKSHYMYQLSDELMEQVDIALAVQLIPSKSKPFTGMTVDDLESVAKACDDLIQAKTINIRQMYDNAAESMITQLVAKINEMTDKIESSYHQLPTKVTENINKTAEDISSNSKKSDLPRIIRNSDKPNPYQLSVPKPSVDATKNTEESSSTEVPTKTKRIRMTTDQVLELLEYADTHSTVETCKKYNLKPTQLYNYKYRYSKT